MPTFLLLETSTDVCSVALARDGKIVAERTTAVFHEHGKKITIFIQEVITSAGISYAELDAIGVSQGPGSFTSLRIGIATAKGLAYAATKPVIALDALRAMAEQASIVQHHETALYLPLIDARSMGVFYAAFDENGHCLQAVSRAKLSKELQQNWPAHGGKLIFCGPAAEKYRDLFGDEEASYLPNVVPRASYLLKQAEEAWTQGNTVDLAYFEPLYIAPPNITTPKKRPATGQN